MESITIKMVCKTKNITLTKISGQMHVPPHTLGSKLNGKSKLSDRDLADLQPIVTPECSTLELFREICAIARLRMTPIH